MSRAANGGVLVASRPASGGATTRRPAPLTRPRRLTEAALLEAACASFAAKGFADTSMDDIADAARTTKPTLYSRVESKETLYRLVIEAEAQRVIEFLLPAYDNAELEPLPQRTRSFVKAFFDYAEAHPEGFRLLFVIGPPAHGTDALDRAFDRVTDRIAEVVRRDLERSANPPQAADLFATMLVGMVYQVVKRQVRDQSWDPEAALDVLSAFIVAGSLGTDPRTLQRHQWH